MSEPAAAAELLRLVARAELSPDQRDRVRAIVSRPVDWGALRAAAEFHRLGPLLFRHVNDAASDACPPGELDVVRREARAVLAVNMALVAELRELVPLLRQHGIEPLVLKGAVLARLFGGIDARPSDDLDLLVPRAQALETWSLLADRGYDARPPIAARWRARWVRDSNEQLFARAGDGLLVDLHWELYFRGYSFDLPQDDLRARAAEVDLGGFGVRSLGPEDTLLFLVIHAAKHEWSSLGWLADVAQLIRSTPIRWEAVVSWASTPGRRRCVSVGLTLAARLLDAPVPPEVLAALEDARSRSLAEGISSALCRFPPAAMERPGTWASLARSVWYECLELPADRARHLYDWLVLPRPGDFAALPLPRWAWPAYFAIRPVRLSWRQLQRVRG